MWAILLSPDVQNFLKKEDKFISDRLRNGLEKLRTDNPFHYLEHFEGQDCYKYRIGNYRALVDVDFLNKQILIRVLDHRGRIYKGKH